jgi:excisionase family DNA binding protein
VNVPTTRHPLLNGPTQPPAQPAIREPGKPWGLAEAARFLGISQRTLATLVADGRIPSYKLAGRRLLADEVLRRVAREGTG